MEYETQPAPNGLVKQLVSFEIGKVYDRRKDLHGPFGGSYQNGITRSLAYPLVFLFTGDSGEQYGYRDHLDEAGVFHYTGEGQRGDMQWKSGNAAIAEHAKEGRALHLFHALGKGKGQLYKGEFAYASHSWHDGPDRDGVNRKIIVFHLVPVGPSLGDVEAGSDSTLQTDLRPVTLTEARAKALASFAATEGKAGRAAVRVLALRSDAVKRYVLMRAAGTCECCKQPAPFARIDGSPYLEPHHINRLSDGGLDHPKFVAAICPTCHRRIHYGNGGAKLNDSLRTTIANKESELLAAKPRLST